MLTGRVAKGAAAGVIAGLVPFAINYLSLYMGWATLVWADFAAIFALGRHSSGTIEHVYAIGAVFWWLSLLGAVYALLAAKLPNENSLLVGWLYSTSIWFASYAMTVMFHISQIGAIQLGTALTHFASASSWGIALPLVLNWLDSRSST